MGKGKKSLIITASIIGGLLVLSMLAALAPDEDTTEDGDMSNTGNQANADPEANAGGAQAPSNSRPTARFTVTCEDLSCNFDASSSSDTDGSIMSYAWDFGDGESATGVTANHTYANDGTAWRAQLTVTDDDGATHSAFDFPDVVAPPPAPLEFSGSGDKVTASFTTAQKLIRVSMEHSGSSNFAIWLLDSQGDQEELMANEIGDYDGTRYFSVAAGEYRMEVTADGSWSVTIEQPRDSGATPGPQSGSADTAVPGIAFEAGLVVMDMTYQGNSNFAIWVYDADGDIVKLAANEIGDYEGQTAVQIPSDGIYYIDVTASDGSWTISFS